MLAAYIGATLYTPWTLGKLFDLSSPKLLYTMFILGSMSIMVSTQLYMQKATPFTSFYYTASMIWLGVFLYVTVFLLGHHLIGIFVSLPLKWVGVGILTTAMALTAFAVHNAYHFKTIHTTIPIVGLQSEVKIALLADIHLGAHRGSDYLTEIVTATNDQNPDLIIIPGDIIDNSSALNAATFAPLKDLRAPAYFVTGNHDLTIDTKKLFAILQANNIIILHNQVIKTHGLNIIGLDYMNVDNTTYDPHGMSDGPTIKDALPALTKDNSLPTIAVHHSPVGMQYFHQNGVDLLLAGHTHGGGQIIPFTLVGNIQFEYVKGLYKYENTAAYVSQGLGTFGPPMRLGTSNELSILTLTPSVDTLATTITHTPKQEGKE
jgi:predicted MPP superfamily phosphohydrolase